MDNKHIPKSVEALKASIETQLEKMKGLSLEESRLQTENELYEEMCETNAKNLEAQKASLRQIASSIYERRDNFCKNAYKTIADMQQVSTGLRDDSKRQSVEEELQKVDTKIAELRRLNVLVNMEMVVIKAELARAKSDQHRVYQDRADQEKIKEQISHLQTEVQQLQLEVAATSSDKRQNAEDILTIAPSPKRPYIPDTVPPNSPTTSSDDESEPIPIRNKTREAVFDFSKCFDIVKGTPQKPKFVFKRPVQSLSEVAESIESKK